MRLSFEADLPYIREEFQNPVWDDDSGMPAGELEKAVLAFSEAHDDLPMMLRRAETFRFLLENVRIAINPRTPFADKMDLGIDYTGFAGSDLFCRSLYEKAHYEILPRLLPEVYARVETASRIGVGQEWLDFWHTIPDWERLIKLGFPGLLREVKLAAEKAEADKKLFYDSLILTLEAVLGYLRRLYRVSLRHDVPDFSACILALTEHEPRTLYEVMEFSILWLYMEEMGVERARSLGPIDRLYAPFYRRDLAEGRLTEEEARELFRYYFMHFSAARRFSAQPVTLGGGDENGVTYANELTDLILDIFEELETVNPKIHFRYHKDLPAHLLPRLMGLIRKGHSAICILNDETILRGYEKLGIPRRDAVNYALLGCYEPVILGLEEAEIADLWLNLVKPLEFTFFGGRDLASGTPFGPETPEDFDTFDDFFSALCTQIDDMLLTGMDAITAQRECAMEMNPSPLYSASFASCVEKGEDVRFSPMKYNNSSVKCCGFATLIDSLAMVKKYVFDRKELSFSRLREILQNNWAGEEKLRLRILADRDKYGSGRDLPDELLKRVYDHITALVVGRPNDRGGVWRFGMDSITNNLSYGSRTAATPDGRHTGEALSKNLCATNGMDREGVTGLMSTLLKLDQTLAIDSAILDFVLHPSAVQGEKGLADFCALVRAYFAAGGFAVQGNMVAGETLRDAQKHPENYSTLQIRVCGWNEYFTAMAKDKQDMFILQTAGR